MNRLEKFRDEIQAKLDALPTEKVDKIDKELDIDWQEHYTYQNCQAAAHVEQVISTDEASFMFRALGQTQSGNNGGWAKGVDTATKFTVTKMIQELLGRRR